MNYTKADINHLKMIINDSINSSPYPYKILLVTNKKEARLALHYLYGQVGDMVSEQTLSNTTYTVTRTVASTATLSGNKGLAYLVYIDESAVGGPPNTLLEYLTHEVFHLVMAICKAIGHKPLSEQEPMAYYTGSIVNQLICKYYNRVNYNLLSVPDDIDDRLAACGGYMAASHTATNVIRQQESGDINLYDNGWRSTSWYS